MRVKQQRKKHQYSSRLLLGIKHHWLLDFFVHLTHQEVTDTFISRDWPSRQKDLKSIYLPLLSRVKGLPNIGEIPLNFQAVHMCYWVSPTSSHASTSTGKTEFCVDLYIPFGWSGTPAHSQRVFCEILCIWRGIPDACVERGVRPLHLLLRHIVFLPDSHC